MKKSQRIKRKAVAQIIWQSSNVIYICLMQLGDLLRMESGVPVHKESPLRGAMTTREFQTLNAQVEMMRKRLENLRKIAKHIEKDTRETR